jgi:predicted TIM-barrel fold metal-dependent hydrolase
MEDIIDAHAHIFKQDMPLNDNPRHSPRYDFTLEDYLQALDAHGVACGVIAAASPWSDYNDYVIESVRGKPRLRGTVIVKPSVERYILELMQRDGIVGVRLPFIGLPTLPDCDSFEYRRLFRRIKDLDWHVHLHVEGERLPEILPVLERAGMKIVIDHLGRLPKVQPASGPGYDAMVRAVRNGRTWVKASGVHRIGPPAKQTLQALLDDVGPERLMWASDCPFVGEEKKITYRQTIDWLIDAVPDARVRRKLFHDNARSFYGFDDGR